MRGEKGKEKETELVTKEKTEPKIYHAWYSALQENVRRGHNSKGDNDSKKCPGCVYWVATDGTRLETTMVTSTKYHNCNSKNLYDLTYQGEVTKYSGICRW